VGLTVGTYIHRLGPGGDPLMTHDPLYKSFIFLLLPVLVTSPDEEPLKQANYTTISPVTAISHTYHQIYNIVCDKQKQNKFDNYIIHDTRETKTTASENKERLRRRIVAAGSSRQVEETVDEVVSWPAALL
jgi:hypothetical protein